MTQQLSYIHFKGSRLRACAVVILIALSANPAFARCTEPVPSGSSTSGSDVRPVTAAKAAPGTYQFIVSQKDNQEYFSADILVTIEQLRKDNATVIYPVSPSVQVRIPSRTEINSPSFVPLPEIFVNDRHEK